MLEKSLDSQNPKGRACPQGVPGRVGHQSLCLLLHAKSQDPTQDSYNMSSNSNHHSPLHSGVLNKDQMAVNMGKETRKKN